MKVRIFNHYHNLPIALLAVVETLLILSSPLIVQTLFVGQSLGALLDAWQVTLPRILAFVACIGVALTAMGLYSARQRARTPGIILRVIVAHGLGLGMFAILSFFVHAVQLQPGRALAWATMGMSVSPGLPPPPSAKSTTGSRFSSAMPSMRSVFWWLRMPCVPARTVAS